MRDERDVPLEPDPADATSASAGHDDTPRPDIGAADGAADGAVDDATDEAVPEAAESDDLEEIDVLRRELARMSDALEAARNEAAEAQDRALRARADLENLRRRTYADLERAHGAGLDAAIGPVLTVHDDLERALVAAEEGGDPSAIVPGVASVLAGLERQLEGLGLTKTGAVGEPFDANRHEALTAVPAPTPEQAGTIQAVFQAGFVQGDRLVRPARVVVYQEA
jgi:molecular chaperone GrpE